MCAESEGRLERVTPSWEVESLIRDCSLAPDIVETPTLHTHSYLALITSHTISCSVSSPLVWRCSQHLLSHGDGEGQVGHSPFPGGKLLRAVRLPYLLFPLDIQLRTLGPFQHVHTVISVQKQIQGTAGLHCTTPPLPRQLSFSLSPSPCCSEPPTVVPSPLAYAPLLPFSPSVPRR